MDDRSWLWLSREAGEHGKTREPMQAAAPGEWAQNPQDTRGERAATVVLAGMPTREAANDDTSTSRLA
jgi:hypothetical protein